MSRRTRIKIRPRQRFTTSHHLAYSSSPNISPVIFSTFGKPVKYSDEVLPFIQNQTITFCGTLDGFQEKQTQYQPNYTNIQKVNISLKGNIVHQYSPFATILTFLLGMLCLLGFYIFKLGCFRNNFFTKYQQQQENYARICKIIEKLKNCKLLVLGIQDNYFDQSKADMLENCLLQTQIKQIIIRNNCYNLNYSCSGWRNYFNILRNKKNKEFKFIWEGKLLASRNRSDEEENLLSSEI